MNIANIIDKVHCADNMEFMRQMPDNCIDTVITDPPYGLGFMGKDWDTFAPDVIDSAMQKDKRAHRGISSQRRSNTAGTYDHSRNAEFQAWFTIWAVEVLRVAKPGAIALVFGGTRTYHRLTCAMEDAGWVIRDCMMWLYGSGFPKSLDISKAIDKAAGMERQRLIDTKEDIFGQYKEEKKLENPATAKVDTFNCSFDEGFETNPASTLAQQWDGWGTSLKPSFEPIIICMKPLDGTFAANAAKWGVAGLNIDGGRIGTDKHTVHGKESGKFHPGDGKAQKDYHEVQGRWPANCILSHHPECGYNNYEKKDLTRQMPCDTIPKNKGDLLWDKEQSRISTNANTVAKKMSHTEQESLQSIATENVGSQAFAEQKQIHSDTSKMDTLCSDGISGAEQREGKGSNISSSIGISGKRPTAKSPKDVSCTTKTKTKLTTDSKISNLPADTNTLKSTKTESWQCHPDCPVRMLDEQSGVLKSGAMTKPYKYTNTGTSFGKPAGETKQIHESSSGGASRFFYCAKASKAERNAGCEGLEVKQTTGGGGMNNTPDDVCGKYGSIKSPGHNFHPTVKPLALVEYLCNLTKTPTGGIVLDPFLGSGTTAVACVRTGRHFIGIEKEADYCKIAEKRIKAETDKLGLFKER